MDKWLKRTVVGIAAAVALGGSIAAYSQAEAHFHGGPPSAEDMAAHEAGFLAHVGKELDLDAAQKARLQALGDLLRTDHEALMKSDPHAKMAELMAGNTFDRATAQAIVDEKLAEVKSHAPALIAATGDFFDSLRADQQQKVRDFMTKHHDHMMSHRPPPAPSN
ncbi:MAG TPA: Spy/CpxP family protein refolding chaperone [Burkholderiaceae bacterium]|nr:Spy/CpxP family protein refolding chaperone [Burkholderiaceae bacterium]